MSERMGFKNYVTPRFIVFAWWVNVIIVVLFVTILPFQTISFQSGKAVLTSGVLWDAMKLIIYGGIALFVVRLWLEFMSIVFSIHDRLIDLAEILERRSVTQPTVAPPALHGTHNPLYAARNIKG